MDAKSSADDIAQVRDAVHRLAFVADFGPLSEYAALLSEDVVWEQMTDGMIPAQALRGRADALAGAQARRGLGIQGPGTQTRHVVTNTVVHPNAGGTSARAVSYWTFFQGVNTTPLVRSCGVYIDLFTRTAPGHWQLQHRQIHRNPAEIRPLRAHNGSTPKTKIARGG